MYEDRMMERALELSRERGDLDSLIRTKALLVGGTAPTEIIADMRLRARELEYLAEAKETLWWRGRRGA